MNALKITLHDMDTLIHWQWVTWLRLCASVSASTSKELVRRSWRPTSSLGVTWRCRSNDLYFNKTFVRKIVVQLVNEIVIVTVYHVLTGTFCLKTRLGTSVGVMYALGGAGDVPL